MSNLDVFGLSSICTFYSLLILILQMSASSFMYNTFSAVDHVLVIIILTTTLGFKTIVQHAQF